MEEHFVVYLSNPAYIISEQIDIPTGEELIRDANAHSMDPMQLGQLGRIIMQLVWEREGYQQ